MSEQRDMEAEREELLRRIEAALPPAIRSLIGERIWAPRLQPKATLSTSEGGSACADQR